MPTVVLDRPYEFVPPHRGTWWSACIQFFELYRLHLKKNEGVVDREVRHIERLKASLDAGHGILLCPNHCRTGDPIVMGWVAKAAGTHVFAMASWHLFNEGRFKAFAIHRMGGFSIHREGMDRKSLDTAVEVVATAERPLILFPEGATSGSNDYLHPLLDGVAFIARTAAKRRAKSVANGKVVVHPIGIKYRFEGDIQRTALQVLADLEKNLSWRVYDELPVLTRIERIGLALLTLKELEYVGVPREGSLEQRISFLIEHILSPLETEWLGSVQTGGTIGRVKAVHMRLLPEMTAGQLSKDEYARRYRQLEALHLVQQLGFYPPGYLSSLPSVDRLLETLERLEVDMVGKARVHRSIKAILEVAPPIEVSVERERGAKVDPLMAQIDASLREMLGRLQLESPLFQDSTPAAS